MYTYTYCVCTYIYIYIHIERERERERDDYHIQITRPDHAHGPEQRQPERGLFSAIVLFNFSIRS